MIMNKTLNFDNSMARWMFSNVILASDMNGNVKPDKGKSADKIDGISALVNAIQVYMEDNTKDEVVIDNTVYSF